MNSFRIDIYEFSIFDISLYYKKIISYQLFSSYEKINISISLYCKKVHAFHFFKNHPFTWDILGDFFFSLIQLIFTSLPDSIRETWKIFKFLTLKYSQVRRRNLLLCILPNSSYFFPIEVVQSQNTSLPDSIRQYNTDIPI